MSEHQTFVLASHWEGFPRSILEAMRAGLPVVATDAGGVSEAVVNNATGFVVDPGDVEALRARLRDLFLDRDLRSKLGAAGRKRYEQRFTFDRLVGETLNVYDEVVGARS
jgi:glycosyltransferase involved in cell wall biosynthesis